MKRLYSWVILLFVSASAVYPCITGCKTTIKIVDCDGEAVAGATVTVTCESDNRQVAAVTDEKGEVQVGVCTNDIEGIGVTANVAEGSGPCPSSPCTIKVCYSSPVIHSRFADLLPNRSEICK